MPALQARKANNTTYSSSLVFTSFAGCEWFSSNSYSATADSGVYIGAIRYVGDLVIDYDISWELFVGGVSCSSGTFTSAEMMSWSNDGVIRNVFSIGSLPAGSVVLKIYKHTLACPIEPPCSNVPDGEATISLVGIDENGQHVAEKKTFSYTSGAVELDFSGILPQLAGGIYGYVIRAGKGFTAGTTTISEHWHSSFGSFDHVRNTYQISVTEGQQQGNIIVPHWVYAIDSWIALVPIPVFFTGRVTLSNSYAELPACMSSVTPDDDQDDTELILDGWIAEQPIEYPHEPVLPEPPDEPEPPTSPIPPDDPEYPYPPQPPTPPTPPAEGCACEIYIGLQIENLITALYDINSIRMQQQHAHVVYLGDHLQNINQNLFDLFQWISTKQNFDMNDLIDKLDEIKESIDDKHIPEPSVEINTSDGAPEVFVNKVYDDYEY